MLTERALSDLNPPLKPLIRIADRARHALLAAPARLEAAVEFVELRRVRSKLETVRSIAEADPLDPTGVEFARQQLDGLP